VQYEVLIVQLGDPRYEEVLGRLRADRALLELMRVQAGFDLVEHPEKVWIIAVDPTGQPLAWCAYEPSDEPGIDVKCVDSCERPECWDEDVYLVVYTARHELIRQHRAVTYIYPEPVELHETDGWAVTGTGISREPGMPERRWYRLARQPG
jgi:hypothetical protein